MKSDGFVIYSDIELSDEEKEYLNLTPKYREFEKLDIEKWHVEVEVNSIKTRWELMNRNKRDENNKDKTEEELHAEEEMARESTDIYNKETQSVTMSNLRVTDLPSVTRLFPPRPAGGQDEIKIQEQASLAKEAFNQYRAKNCDHKGNLNISS